MAKQRTEQRQITDRGVTITATWNIGSDGKPTSDGPASLTFTTDDDRGIGPSMLLRYREHGSEWIRDVHKRPDTVRARKEALTYLAEHLDDLTVSSRTDVSDSYYTVLDKVASHLQQIGLVEAEALRLIAQTTGSKEATVRNRYYTLKRKEK